MGPTTSADRPPEPVLPIIDDENRGFWEGCAAGELRIQACADCGRLRHMPRPMCPWCNSLASEWRAVSGRGRVWSFVVAHPPLLPWFAAMAPYNCVVVELEDDPTIRLVGNLVTADDPAALDALDPATIEIGEPVRVVFDPVTDEVAMPRWTRA